MDSLQIKTDASNRNVTLLDRRQWLIASMIAAGAISLTRPSFAESKRLATKSIETGKFRIRAVSEVSGEIRLKSQINDAKAKNGKLIAAKTAPMKASSTLEYDEHYESSLNILQCRTYQHFREATSEIQVDRHVTKTSLREQCRDILRFGSDQGLVTACPDNPLFAAERDLIECPINSMFLDQLLTEREVNIADKWTVEREVACRLLNVDAIQDGKLVMCLVEADESKAQLELNGTIAASVRQVPTTIVLEGKLLLDRSTGTISWFAVNLDETREISEAEPGFHVNAQVKILRSGIESMVSGLTLDEVAQRITNQEAASLLQFQSDLGYYRFLANRKWSTYRDNGEEATLRYVVNDRVLCQCNVTNMIDLEAGRQLSLEGFRSDVKAGLGSSLSEMIEGTERLTSNKLRMLRIVSRGSVQGVGILWIHYHLSNDTGRRVVLAFTLNESNLEAFSEEDAQITDSFELVNWPTKVDEKSLDAAAQAAKQTEDKKVLVSQPTKNEQAEVKSRPKMAR